MRSAILLNASLLKFYFTTGCCMKKNRIDIQLFLHHVVYITTIQKFLLSAVNCLTTLNHSTHLDLNGIAYTSYTILNKNKTQSFQLPK